MKKMIIAALLVVAEPAYLLCAKAATMGVDHRVDRGTN